MTAAQVWATICRHIDGVAVGTTVAALAEHGALAVLAGQEPVRFGALCDRLAANPGFLNVAMRLLADQGWVVRQGEPGTDEMGVMATPRGRVAMTRLAPGYQSAVACLASPLEISAGRFLEGWGLPSADVPAEVREHVRMHLDGHVLAPVMHALTRDGILRPGEDLPLRDGGLSGPVAAVLAHQGWAEVTGEVARLTPDGEVAVALAVQYRYPMVYLPLLRRARDLIFGEPGPLGDERAESHLDRELDLRFSAEVFNRTCREPFLRIALPLFSREPLRDQPAIVVDTGCGDGGLLEALYETVRGQTVRGNRLGEYPLVMVAADPSPVARRMAGKRLSAAGVPHIVLDGDIADPDALSRGIAARGLDAGNALHVCKSAIHDRGYADPGPGCQAPVGSGAYALPDGNVIPSSLMARNLAGLFRRWLPVTARHGWLVIEAHSAPATTVAALHGRSLATVMDATHGYSCQYPVEPGVFAWAARTAGFISRQHLEPGARVVGHTVLTIDHFVPAGPRAVDQVR
jgi:hypothetical protein